MPKSMSSLPAAPLPESYWVLPGRLLAGGYPASLDAGATRERLERLLAAGVDRIVDLTETHELPAYAQWLPGRIEHHRHAIRDHSVPADPAEMRRILALIETSLEEGRRLYVHCRAGIGRTGTVVGCLLVEQGLSGEEALAALNRASRASARAGVSSSVPETASQAEYVRGWVRRAALAGGTEGPAPQAAGLADRFRGALVGLAVGDALAVATQDRVAGTFEPVTAPLGGGPFALPAGAWSDDTAMALCLAESLAVRRAFDAADQVERYDRWLQTGHLSATGESVGVTPSVRRALGAARWRRQRFSGSHEPRQLDPEPLSRVAPAVMFAFADPGQAVRLAGDAARVTCQAPAVLEACRLFAAMLHAALSGRPKDEVLAPQRGFAGLDVAALRPRIQALGSAGWRSKPRERIRAGGTAVHALEAALSAFDRTLTFREGALLAANLGERSDVAAAVYGQLAGAYYTAHAIPLAWRRDLARIGLIEELAQRLYAAHA